MASMTKPLSLCCRQRRSIEGISWRQGGHHVAQKLMSTGWPRCCDRRKLLPPSSGAVKSSAAFVREGRIRSNSLIASSTLSWRPARGLEGAAGGGGAGGAAGEGAAGGAGRGGGGRNAPKAPPAPRGPAATRAAGPPGGAPPVAAGTLQHARRKP